MKHVFNLIIEINSNGPERATIKKTVSKINQIMNLLNDTSRFHAGGFADDIALADYWFESIPSLDITNFPQEEDTKIVPRAQCSECKGSGEIRSFMSPDHVFIKCSYCDGTGTKEIK